MSEAEQNKDTMPMQQRSDLLVNAALLKYLISSLKKLGIVALGAQVSGRG
jgi:hypothetical protein